MLDKQWIVGTYYGTPVRVLTGWVVNGVKMVTIVPMGGKKKYVDYSKAPKSFIKWKD